MVWKRYLAVGILSLWFFLFLYSTAYAYLDPGTGSYACQIMLAGLMGGLFLAKMYWARIKDSLSRFLVKDKGEKDA